jgi:hypothetical protein
MSTLVEIEEAINRLPDLDVDQLAEWLERRRARKSSQPVSPRDPQFVERARQIWGDRPSGVALSELVSRSRA